MLSLSICPMIEDNRSLISHRNNFKIFLFLFLLFQIIHFYQIIQTNFNNFWMKNKLNKLKLFDFLSFLFFC